MPGNARREFLNIVSDGVPLKQSRTMVERVLTDQLDSQGYLYQVTQR